MADLPKAILFDLDETILFFGHRQQILSSVAREHQDLFGAISPEEIGQIVETAFVDFWADHKRHKAWRFSLLEARIKILQSTFESLLDRAPNLTREFAEQFAREFHERREEEARFFPDALETLETLKNLGVKLALVTNGSAVSQRRKILKFDLVPRFDHIQIEGEVGFGKPEPQAYLFAMEKLDVAAPDTWMVGDNLEWEVVAPQKLGIYSIWHDYAGKGLPRDSSIKPDRIIRLISELIENGY